MILGINHLIGQDIFQSIHHMIKDVFKKIVNILLLPFREHFMLFLVLSLLTAFAHSVGYFTTVNFLTFSSFVAIIMHCISLSYIATLLISLIRKKVIRRIVLAIILIYVVIDFIVNFYCAFYLHLLFDNDVALLIKETDPSEAGEFFSSLVPAWIVLTITGVFALIILSWWFMKKRDLKFNLGKKASVLALGIVAICMMGNLRVWEVWEFGPFSPIHTFAQNDNPSDLRLYYTHPQLQFDENQELPTNLVLIIGESFGRSHSSIYGYEKMTNPLLAKLKDDQLLFYFDSIYSPASQTAKSLRYMLSTYDLPDEGKDKKWFEYISLIELMDECGFDCYWFGNQGRVGDHNGPTRAYAQACDHQWFLQKDNILDQSDVVLVDSTSQYVSQISHKNHNFIVYHMKGSHFDYSKRYPPEFARFTVNDYPSDPESHRLVLSSYDNSILYNDYIVNQLMAFFKDTESIIIYLSDHGQVMYRNSKDPDYYAHGRKEDPVDYACGTEIPFFIYASPLYQQKHPEIMERIKYRQDHPENWNSDDLPYFILDLIGVKEINHEDIRSKSVLN